MTPFRGDNIQKYEGSLYGMRVNPVTGKKEMHRGRDITTPGDLTVRECTGGTVIRVEYDSARGNYIDVRTSPHHFERYQHMASIYLKKGDAAPQGKHLGLAGSTGMSTGIHLHFGVYAAGPETDHYTSLEDINKLEAYSVEPTPWLDIPNKRGTYEGNNDYDNAEPGDKPNEDAALVEARMIAANAAALAESAKKLVEMMEGVRT